MPTKIYPNLYFVACEFFSFLVCLWYLSFLTYLNILELSDKLFLRMDK